LVEDPDVAVRDDVQLQGLELEAPLVRHVADREVPEVRQLRLRADRVVLRNLDGDLVARVLVRPGLDLRQLCVDSGAGVRVGVVGHGRKSYPTCYHATPEW